MFLINNLSWFRYGLSLSKNTGKHFEIINKNGVQYGIVKCFRDDKFVVFDIRETTSKIRNKYNIPLDHLVSECHLCKEWEFYMNTPEDVLTSRLGYTTFGRGLQFFDTLEKAKKYIDFLSVNTNIPVGTVTFLSTIGYNDLNPPEFYDCNTVPNPLGTNCENPRINIFNTSEGITIEIDHSEGLEGMINFKIYRTSQEPIEVTIPLDGDLHEHLVTSETGTDAIRVEWIYPKPNCPDKVYKGDMYVPYYTIN